MMADPPGWTHLLLESGQLDNLQSPLRGSARLRFTCLSVSVRFIALGSNTGNVYIFDRLTQKHLQVVFPEVDPAAVNVVSLCPNEKLVAFSTLNGHVIVMEMNVDRRARPERLKLVTEHMRTTVTCIQWEHSGGKIYVSDVTGKVSMTVVPKVKNLVVMPVDVIMRLESAVIQMDWSDNKLLVSTMTRAYCCNTLKQQYSQIGKKPREGEYGACFYKLSKTSFPMMYCARPSSRVWEVDYEGNVLSTHQFKHLLATPPIKVIDINDKEWVTTPTSEWAGQGINLPRLKMFGSQYLLSWKNNRVYILNPVKVKVILWTELDTGIKDLCTVKSDMYLFMTSGEVRRIQMFAVSQVVSILQKKNVTLAADLCCKFQQVLLKGKWRKHLSVDRLQSIQQQIKGTDLENDYNIFMVEASKNDVETISDEDDSSETGRSRSSSSASVQSYSKVINTVNRMSTEEAILDCDVTDHDSNQDFSAIFSPNGENFRQTDEVCKENGAHNYCHSDADNKQDINEQIDIEKLHTGSNSPELQSNEVIVENNIVTKVNREEFGDSHHDRSCDLGPSCDTDIDREINGKPSLQITSALVHSEHNNDDNVAASPPQDEIDNTLPVESHKILQNDEDLAPVLALNQSSEVSTSPGKVKKKRRVKTVNLGVPSTDNKTKPVQKGTKSGGGMKRSVSTSIIDGALKTTDFSQRRLSLDIYQDDIFSEERSPSQNVENKTNLLDESLPESSSLSSEGVTLTEGRGTISSTSAKSLHNGTPADNRKTGGMVKVKSESDIASNLKMAHCAPPPTHTGDRPHTIINDRSDGKETEFSNSYERKSAEFMSSSERKNADLTASLDSSSLGSSPSQSPLSQSWEGPTAGSHTSSSPKVSLSSMKDSLQSRFSVTKRKFLKTIKEKALLTKSPSQEDLSGMNFLPKPHSGDDLLTMDSVANKGKPVFGSIAESSGEQVTANTEPPVDLSELMAKTDSTLKILQDTNVVLNSAAVMDTLMNWVTQLNQTLQVLHTKVYTDQLAARTLTDSSNKGQVQNKALDNNTSGDLKDGGSQKDDGIENVTLDPYSTDKWTECWSNTESGQTTDHCVESDAKVGDNDQSEKVVSLEDQSTDKWCLEMCSMELAQQVSDTIHSLDPFHMPDDLFNNVAELARTCFLAGCYGYVSLYSKPSDTKIDNITDNNAEGKTCSVRNKDEISFQESEEEHSKVCDISSASNTPKQQPSFQDSGELCDKDLPKMDSAERLNSSDEDVCTFMRNYCFLLDLCKIRENLHSYQGNLFQFWCTYTRCLHEFYKKDIFFVKLMNKEVHYAVDILRTGNYCTEKVLSCVTKLFEENLDRALEICQDSPHIQPLDVYFMCQYHSQSVSQYFYPYMYNRVNDTITTNRHGDSVYGHSLVRLKWLEMLLVENRPADDLIGKDNLPRPGSHLADWKKPEFIIHVLSAAEDDMEREEFLGLLHSSGFWRGYLQLLQQLQRREDIFTTIVHLGDISLFGSKYNYVPQTKEEWTFVVHLLHRQYMSLQSSHSTSGALFKDQPATKGAVSKDNSEKLPAHPVEKGYDSNGNGEDILDYPTKKGSVSEDNSEAIEYYPLETGNISKDNSEDVEDYPLETGNVSKDNSEDVEDYPLETGNVSKDNSEEEGEQIDKYDSCSKGKVSNKNSENPDLEIKKPSMSEFMPNTSVKSPGYTSQDGAKNDLQEASKRPPSYCGDTKDVCKEYSWPGCIPWEDFASLMLCHLGPVATVTILQELDIHQGQLSAYFHQSALITMLLNRTKRNVTHNFLEKLDSYLWAKKPTTLMPELRYCVMQEKMTKGTSQRDRDSLISYMPEAAQPCERYQEDRESQWGISAKLSRSCMCCNLSLTEAVSHVEPGILTFQCGHLFHRLCVPEKMCLLCGLPSHQQPTHV